MRIIEPICDAMGIPHHDISHDGDVGKIQPAIEQAYAQSLPRRVADRPEAGGVMMKRDECFRILARHVTDEASWWRPTAPRSTGSRSIRAPLNYFSIGAMGLASSHGLGLALGRPDKRIDRAARATAAC